MTKNQCRAKNPSLCRVHGNTFAVSILRNRLRIAKELYKTATSDTERYDAYQEMILSENIYFSTDEGKQKIQKWLTGDYPMSTKEKVSLLKQRTELAAKTPIPVKPSRWVSLPPARRVRKGSSVPISSLTNKFDIEWNPATKELYVTILDSPQKELIGKAETENDAFATSSSWYNKIYLHP
jgi:hypothetical protein